MRRRDVVVLVVLAFASIVGLLSAERGNAAFPGTSGLITITAVEGNQNVIDVVNPDGTGRRRLAAGAYASAWSPDGRRLVAVASGSPATLVVMNADGSGRRTVASGSSPAWAPDGARIAFVRQSVVYVVNADGSGERRITPGNGFNPEWSPDGTRLVYHNCPGGNCDIYVINADGTGEARLTTHPTTDIFPAWSPDGTKIAFTTYRNVTGPIAPFNTEIYVMNADGSAQTRLTTTAGEDQQPSWSPDGRKIAFSSNRDGNWEVYAMNADGSGQANLTKSPALDLADDWQPTVDLALSASPRTRTVRAGKKTSFTAVVRNTSPAAASAVTLTFRLTGRGGKILSVRGAGASCKRGTCTAARLDADAQLRLVLTLKGARPGKLTARISVAATQADPSLTNNRATVQATVRR